LQSEHNTSNYAEYSTFRVLSEADSYKLQVGGYSGNSGSDALNHQNGEKFSTYDRDNDPYSGNCVAWFGGGFWYDACAWCPVNAARGAAAFYCSRARFSKLLKKILGK